MLFKTVVQVALAVINSYQQIAIDWDQVKEVSITNYQKSQLNQHYFYPYSIVLFVFFDCLYIWAENGFHYSYTGMPRFLFHYTFPREFWQQGDILLSLTLSMGLVVYPLLIVDPMLDKKFAMHLSVDKKTDKVSIKMNNEIPLSTLETTKIVQFRYKMRSIFPFLVASIWLPVEMFYMWNFFQKWTNSLRDYIMSTVTIIFFLNITIGKLLFF